MVDIAPEIQKEVERQIRKTVRQEVQRQVGVFEKKIRELEAMEKRANDAVAKLNQTNLEVLK